MANANEAQLQEALFEHIKSLSTTPETYLAEQNVNSDNLVPRLEVQHVPNNSRVSTIDGGKDLVGLLAITVVTKEGEGALIASRIASQVVSHFEGQTLYPDAYRVRFVEPPSIGQSLQDEGEVRTLVTIPYIAND